MRCSYLLQSFSLNHGANQEINGFEEKVLSRVHSLNPFSGGEGLIFWRRSFGKRFFWSTCEAMVIIS
jgi:hypothetical protein